MYASKRVCGHRHRHCVDFGDLLCTSPPPEIVWTLGTWCAPRPPRDDRSEEVWQFCATVLTIQPRCKWNGTSNQSVLYRVHIDNQSVEFREIHRWGADEMDYSRDNFRSFAWYHDAGILYAATKKGDDSQVYRLSLVGQDRRWCTFPVSHTKGGRRRYVCVVQGKVFVIKGNAQSYRVEVFVETTCLWEAVELPSFGDTHMWCFGVASSWP